MTSTVEPTEDKDVPKPVCTSALMAKHRELCSILQLGLGFFFILTAFNSQAFIIIALLRSLAEDPNFELSSKAGYYSKSILYLTFMFSNLLVPPIISKIGAKWALVAASATYVLYMLAFVKLQQYAFYAASGLVGFGAALIWTANGVFLVEHSKKENLGRNSALMWTVMQTSLIAGSLCFVVAFQLGEMIQIYRQVYFIFAIFASAGVLTFALLPAKPQDVAKIEISLENAALAQPEKQKSPTTLAYVFTSTFHLALTKKMGLMIVVFFFLGAQLVFSGGVYAGCVKAMKNMAGNESILPYLVMSFGAGAMLGKRKKSAFGQTHVVIAGTLLLLTSYGICILFLPHESPLKPTEQVAFIKPTIWIALVPPFLFGLGDSCWQTQVLTMVGSIWREEQSAPSFAIFKFFQAAAACIGYFSGSIFGLYTVLGFVSALAIISAINFCIVHHIASKQDVS